MTDHSPHVVPQTRRAQTRRQFFQDCGVGVGKIALASLCAEASRTTAAAGTTAPSGAPASDPTGLGPHFRPRATRVIHLFMAGAPSQLDLFDYKPLLERYDGQPVPAEVVKDQRYAFIQRNAALLAPRFKFARQGHSGAEISEKLPHLARVVDELAIVKSVHTDQFNHAPAQIFFNTGSPLPGRPAIGAWVTYGLGSEADDLPGFVVLATGGGTSGGTANFSAGFLPTRLAGVPFRNQGDPILNVSNPAGIDARGQRETLDLVRMLNERQLARVGDPEIASRISAYEMAYRLQTRAPELMNTADEPEHVWRAYGAEPGKSSFALNCLLARRLIERGVRYVSVYHNGWDHHSDVAGGLTAQCGQTDQASAALIADLKQRGLLDETLVVWGGEFGRTPMVESNAALGRSLGRDHHPQAFSMWLAGGGIRPGITLGQTDDIGFHVAADPVHVHDIQATILHLLGLDHERLTFTTQGRPFRLTDVHGHVVRKLLA